MQIKRESNDLTSINDAVKITIQSTETGRSVIHHDDSNPTDTDILQKHIQSFVEKSDPTLEKFLDKIIENFCCRLEGNAVTCYRGLKENDIDKLTEDRIGPSPSPPDNRYNIMGESCLYLCIQSYGIGLELGCEDWLEQEYVLPLDQISIADILASNIHNTLALAFFMSERGQTSSGYPIEEELEKRKRSRYSFSQLLAILFKKHHWDGFVVPGVHGRNSKQYSNLVVFKPAVDCWRAWTKARYYIHSQK